MPAMILDEKEKSVSRFVSNNGLVEDPCALEKERALINPWTNEEKEIFMDKLATLGKYFGKIASFLDHKTTADCVEFYYKNHKSDCFEKTKKKQGKPSSTSTYLVTSEKKWSRDREMNAASLDILGAASVIAAQAEEAIEPSKSISGKSGNRKPRGSDGIFEASSSYCLAEDDREIAAADVLAGICGSLSSEAMSSYITSSVDPADGNQDLKHQKVGSSERRPLTPEVTQKVDNDGDAYSDESCGEMDLVDWTDDDKSLFVQAFSSYGKDFTMISQAVRTKSRDQCRVFFSKVRKCLGLDNIPHGTGIHGSTDGNEGGGSDAEDAYAVETGSVVCSDKSGSRMDEDLPHINHDVSKPETSRSVMDTLQDNCSAEEGECKDDGYREDITAGDCAVVNSVHDDIARGEPDPITQNDPSKAEASRAIGVIDIERVPTNERSVSKLANDLVNVSSSFSVPVGPRDGCYQKSTTIGDDDSNRPEASGSVTMNQSDPSQILKGFPLDSPFKADAKGNIPCKVGPDPKEQSFDDTFLRNCRHEQPLQDAAIVSLPLVVRNEGPVCSLETEKPCRNGNVKLFGKILSTPSSTGTGTPSCSAQINGKSAHEHNNLVGLENVPIRSYGFWDGTRIQTGLSSMPASALLLAKYPAAFGNYAISLSSSLKDECNNVNGSCEAKRDTFPRFTMDVKQEQDSYPEAKRDTFGGIPRLQEGGEVIVNGVSDPVAALKLHYARPTQQHKQTQFTSTNGLIREEDVGR